MGVSLRELDEVGARGAARRRGALPFLGYHPSFAPTPFPAVLCVSVNDAIVHGIPDDYRLRDGDLVSVDFGAELGGWAGDSAISFIVGEPAPRRRTAGGDRRAGPRGGYRGGGRRQPHRRHRARDRRGVPDGGLRHPGGFGGHGIGRRMHEDPPVPNEGRPGRGMPLRHGMVLAIEPMLIGSGKDGYHEAPTAGPSAPTTAPARPTRNTRWRSRSRDPGSSRRGRGRGRTRARAADRPSVGRPARTPPRRRPHHHRRAAAAADRLRRRRATGRRGSRCTPVAAPISGSGVKRVPEGLQLRRARAVPQARFELGGRRRCAGWRAARRSRRPAAGPRSRKPIRVCSTVVMMVAPPGEPRATTGLRCASSTIVGEIEERGRLPGPAGSGRARPGRPGRSRSRSARC